MTDTAVSSGKSNLRVLIITYYWPPSGGGGVQRWLKLSNEFIKLGVEPIIYTASNPEYPIEDHSMLDEVNSQTEVIKHPIWEPYSIYKRFVGKSPDAKVAAGFVSNEEGLGTMEKISRWIRGNIFIPDARKYWIKPSVKFLKSYIKENPVDAIISTGPPHSTHLIARGISRSLGVKWVADFRDLWTEIDFVDELRLTQKSERKHHQLESSVLEEAEAVVTVSKDFRASLAKNGDISKIHIVPNGFDSADFGDEDVPLDEKFTVTYLGSLSAACNVQALWGAISELCDEEDGFREDFRFKIAGQIDKSIYKSIEDRGLSDLIVDMGYVDHLTAVRMMASGQVLLIILNSSPYAKGILTGKIFEYFKSSRPILPIAHPDGDLSHLIAESGGKSAFAHGDNIGIKTCLLEYYRAYRAKDLTASYHGLERFERGQLAKDYLEIVRGIASL